MSWFSRYNDEVNRLISHWVVYMEETGQVLKIYPFFGVTESILMRDTTKLCCGAGWAEFNIQTDGNITPCPVMAGMKNFYLGNIWETNPRDLVDAARALAEHNWESRFQLFCASLYIYAFVAYSVENSQKAIHVLKGLTAIQTKQYMIQQKQSHRWVKYREKSQC